MAKIIIEFDTENMEDMHLHKRMISSDNMAAILWELKANFFRHKEDMAVADILDDFHRLFTDHNIDIYDLYA
jgi:hypothetical protein